MVIMDHILRKIAANQNLIGKEFLHTGNKRVYKVMDIAWDGVEDEVTVIHCLASGSHKVVFTRTLSNFLGYLDGQQRFVPTDSIKTVANWSRREAFAQHVLLNERSDMPFDKYTCLDAWVRKRIDVGDTLAEIQDSVSGHWPPETIQAVCDRLCIQPLQYDGHD